MLTEKEQERIAEHNREVSKRIETKEYKPFLKAKIIMAKAKVKKTMKKAKTIKRAEGKNGLGVIQTWIKLFQDNAKAKLTDEQISAQIKKNFPGRESAIFDHPGTVRTRYNVGLLTKGKVPATLSVRYDEQGNETSARGKSKVAKKVVAKKTTKKAVGKKGFIATSEQQKK